MMRRALLAAVGAWLAVVLVGATVVWAVISRAGQELVSGDAVAQAGAAPSVSGPTLRTSSPPGPIARRSDRPSARPSRSSPSTAPPSSGPSTPPPSAPASSAGPSTKPPASSPPPPPPPKQSATWRQRPGTVTVTCQGSTIRLDSLLANAGWESERPEAHGGSLEVHFHRTGGEGEVELTAWCSGGQPRFASREDDD